MINFKKLLEHSKAEQDPMLTEGQPIPPRPTYEYFQGVAARFWPKVKKSQACWEWQGALNYYGYGVLVRGNGNKLLLKAHRVSYILHYGEIPNNIHVCHKCDNPKCVNPEHLFLGTDKDNQQDKWRKGRGNPPPIMCGSKNPYSKLTEIEVLKIRTLRKEGWLCRELAELFPQLHPASIKNIAIGRGWKHVQV